MLFSEFNSVSNSISNFVRIGENEFDRCSVNFTNRFPIFSATEEYGLDFPVSSATAATNSVLLNSFLLKKLGYVKSKSKP